jgi:NAD(P)-dependent dehydrogenase (short-subunit alcohol dehydrogenase family)
MALVPESDVADGSGRRPRSRESWWGTGEVALTWPGARRGETEMDTRRHSGRVVLVTGAGSGIGRASAIRFAREGARVIGCDVEAGGLAGTLMEIDDAGLEAGADAASPTSGCRVGACVSRLPRSCCPSRLAGTMIQRFKQVVHPAAGIWMHHLEIHDLAEIDEQVSTWLQEAADYAG